MTDDQIDEILERARSWSPQLKAKAAEVLLIIEGQEEGIYEMSEEELADVAAGEAEIERGEIATHEEMKALFDRYDQR